MNHERSIKCIHNIYSTVVKSVCSCRIMQSGELYKYLQILLTSWRQSSGGPLGSLEGGSTWCTRGSWRNRVCFPFTCRSFYGQATFFWEVHTKWQGAMVTNCSRRWAVWAWSLSIKKKILPLWVRQVLPERPQDLCLWWYLKQDRARPSAAWSNFADGLALTVRLYRMTPRVPS